MQGYKLTLEQKESIQGKQYAPYQFFNCVKDYKDNWFTFLTENDKRLIYNSDYSWLLEVDLELFVSDHYTPPPLTYMGIEIPDQFIWVFPDNKFIVEGFEIPLTNGAVDIAYFQWQAFRDCLDNGNHDYLKRALMTLWDYVAEQVENQNFVQL